MNYAQAVLAYILWGIFPLYWKLLPSVNAYEIICHRIVWSLLTLIICVHLTKQWPHIRALTLQTKRLKLCILAAVFISMNWFIFIWAVQHGYLVETSLGYFINPMLNVLLGVLFFREQLHRLQWLAISIAVVGVAIMTLQTGEFPWIAVSLALSFSFYSVVKKLTTLPAIAGLGMETAILAPISVVSLIIFSRASIEVEPKSVSTWILLILGGPITTLPLVLFAAAAKQVPMVAMGMLQYISPSIQFVLGVVLFQEEVTSGRVVGFAMVWLALAVFSAYAIVSARRIKPVAS
ncbi:MAG: EamA family transporter RarD [Pirellula sp.]